VSSTIDDTLSTPKTPTAYRVGISFEGTNAQNIRFVKGLIRSYYYKKDEYRHSPSTKPKIASML
jgi:hypothetical protein